MDIAHPLSPLGHGGIAHTLPRLNSSKASPLPELDHGDFLAIDDLLDFSNEDIGGPIEPCLSNATSSLATAPSELKLGSCVSSPMDKKPSQQTPSVFDSDELCVPCDDLAELEWLSNFVEESFSSGDTHASLAFGANGGFGKEEKAHRGSINEPFQSTSPVSVLESTAHSREKLGSALSFSPEISVPGRARSKRCRTAVCFWNTRILSAEASESILESSSTTSTITAASSDSDIFTAYYDHADDDDEHHLHHHHQHKRADSASPKVKKFCKLYDSFSNSKPKRIKVQDGVPVRKCLHCATQKTPQWRAGPMGPKTLCNACGVRYKSGRLCPEYRPAASPTFVENFHSNSHRRVLEMRRQRGELISSDHHSHEKRQNQLHCRGNGDNSGGGHNGSDNSLSADE